MYRPPAFREDRVDVLIDAILAHPLGTLMTAGPNGPIANLVPFTVARDGPRPVLRAHLAKANDQIADLRARVPTLVMFQGPHGYVSPGWYPTKAADARVVPTWNYIAVQVAGTPHIVGDAAWLRAQIDTLTTIHEADRAEPWQVDDAPAAFVTGQMKGIVGLEIPADRIEGKWKVSQNQPAPNRAGVERGLRADGGAALADAVARRSPERT